MARIKRSQYYLTCRSPGSSPQTMYGESLFCRNSMLVEHITQVIPALQFGDLTAAQMCAQGRLHLATASSGSTGHCSMHGDLA